MKTLEIDPKLAVHLLANRPEGDPAHDAVARNLGRLVVTREEYIEIRGQDLGEWDRDKLGNEYDALPS